MHARCEIEPSSAAHPTRTRGPGHPHIVPPSSNGTAFTPSDVFNFSRTFLGGQPCGR